MVQGSRVYGTRLALVKKYAAEGDLLGLLRVGVLELRQVGVHLRTQLCIELREGGLNQGLVENLQQHDTCLISNYLCPIIGK